MKRNGIIVLLVLSMLLSGCAPYKLYKEDLNDFESSFDIEECSAPTKTGHNIVLENNNVIQQYREHYGLGVCHSLEGNQTIALFFVDDEESSWDSEQIVAFTNRIIIPALEFLQNQAKQWGVDLSFQIKRYSTALSDGPDMIYDGSVIKDLSISGSTKDIPKQIATIFGFGSELELFKALVEEYESESIIPLMLINKDGTAYARNQLSEQIVDGIEHAVIFADPLDSPNGFWKYSNRRAATTAHEILHLFGAEDYYIDPDRLRLAEKFYIDDIMLMDNYSLSKLKIDKATAYYIGWSDEVPEVCYDEKWG